VRGFGQRVDHFAGAGVVELLAGGVFNGVGIALEALVVRGHSLVFLLQVLDLLLQFLSLMLFLFVGGKTVVIEDDEVADDQRKCQQDNGGDSAARTEQQGRSLVRYAASERRNLMGNLLLLWLFLRWLLLHAAPRSSSILTIDKP